MQEIKKVAAIQKIPEIVKKVRSKSALGQKNAREKLEPDIDIDLGSGRGKSVLTKIKNNLIL